MGKESTLCGCEWRREVFWIHGAEPLTQGPVGDGFVLSLPRAQTLTSVKGVSILSAFDEEWGEEGMFK